MFPSKRESLLFRKMSWKSTVMVLRCKLIDDNTLNCSEDPIKHILGIFKIKKWNDKNVSTLSHIDDGCISISTSTRASDEFFGRLHQRHTSKWRHRDTEKEFSPRRAAATRRDETKQFHCCWYILCILSCFESSIWKMYTHFLVESDFKLKYLISIESECRHDAGA